MEISTQITPYSSNLDSKLTQTARQQPQEAQKVLETNRSETKNYEETKSSEPMDAKELELLVAEMNEMAKAAKTKISFGFSDEAGMLYLNVVDDDSGRVISQFPSKEALEFASKMREWVGMLLDKTI